MNENLADSNCLTTVQATPDGVMKRNVWSTNAFPLLILTIPFFYHE